MGEENRSLLEEEIKAEIKRLGSLESGSQEHTTAVDSLTKLYKLKLEEDKNTYERLDKIENRENHHQGCYSNGDLCSRNQDSCFCL